MELSPTERMEPSPGERRLLAAIADGLPLVPRPYAAIGAEIGLDERTVIETLRRLIDQGVIKRFGVVVRHHELGYRANAMVVWDVPEVAVAAAGRRLAALPFVTLCYRRPRRPPVWPYNLFCMIHGRERATVEAQAEEASRAAGLTGCPRAILFSRRRFKQRGARYDAAQPEAA
jgi:DNA-binding Lrp family transcriptional regulator